MSRPPASTGTLRMWCLGHAALHGDDIGRRPDVHRRPARELAGGSGEKIHPLIQQETGGSLKCFGERVCRGLRGNDLPNRYAVAVLRHRDRLHLYPQPRIQLVVISSLGDRRARHQ